MSNQSEKTAADVGKNSATYEVEAVNDTTANPLDAKKYKKNAFRSRAPSAYRPAFIKQVEDNIVALVLGDLEDASMVHQDKRSLTFKLRIGQGGKNQYVRNPYHLKDEYLDYATIPEAIDALHVIRRKAKDGEFDEALDELLVKRQTHAKKMADARKRKADKKGVFASPTNTDLPKAA